MRFVIGGSGYPAQLPWPCNIYLAGHLPPRNHPAFFCSSRLMLNITRSDMASMGYCPSGRLFQAAATGVPVVGDCWDGQDDVSTPDAAILIARKSRNVGSAP